MLQYALAKITKFMHCIMIQAQFPKVKAYLTCSVTRKKERETETDRQTDRYRQTDRQTDRDRQRDRACVHGIICVSIIVCTRLHT